MRLTSLVLLAVAMSLAIVLPVSAVSAADLPSLKLAEFKGLDGGAWAPAEKDADHGFRAAKAGKGGKITVPVWWGPAFRPKDGEIIVLKISYKDTAAKPIVFSSHAGSGSYWGPSEVHRFGGLGDGQWKTADVPLSWDLVCRKNEFGKTLDVTEWFIQADADLPVESIVAQPAGPDAAAKFQRETREWVARVQADKRKDIKLERQQPVLPEAMKSAAVVPFARSYLVPVLPGDAPQKGEAGAAVKVRMARNEYETAAFAVYANGKDLKNVTFAVDLPVPGFAGQTELLSAEYSAVKADKDGKVFRLFPQRMWPMYPVDIPAGQSHLFWVTLKTQGAASSPGRYVGKVNVKSDAGTAQLPIEVEVVPVTLLTMQEAGLELGGCSNAVTLQELAGLAEHNHTGMDIWFGGTQPQMRVKGGKLEVDFTYLDQWMQAAKKLGMTHMMWFGGGDPYGFPDTLNLERDLYCSQEGERAQLRRDFIKKTSANPDKVIPELRPLYVELVRQIAKQGKEKGWPKIILHPFDEPAKWVQSTKWNNPFAPVIGSGAWIKPHFQDACALIREGAKGYDNVVTGGDIHHAVPGLVFVKDVDVFCTNAIHEDLKLGEKVRAGGAQFWQYSGCGDQAPPHQGRFAFGFYFGAFESTGFLIWAYSMHGRFDTSSGSNWGYGWHSPFGLIRTPYLIGVREGADDRRWIETYKKQAGPAAKAVLDPMFQAAIEQRTKKGLDTVTDFYAEMEKHERMDQWRGKIMDELIKK